MLHSRWIKWIAIAFVAFYVFTRPTSAGNAVQNAVSTVQTGADRAATFVNTAIK